MTKEVKKFKNRRNLRVAKNPKSEDNNSEGNSLKKVERPEHENIEVVFHSDSKEAIESCPHPQELIMALQYLVLKYQKEIHAVGETFNVKLDGRVVFNALKPKE